MKILFFLPGLDVGGVEMVTLSLAKKFTEEGHTVSIASLSKPVEYTKRCIQDSTEIIILSRPVISFSNIRLLRKFITDRGIDLVINQWGQHFIYCILLWLSRPETAKIISCYHNQPNEKAIQKYSLLEAKPRSSPGFAKKQIIKLFREFVKYGYFCSMRLVYIMSDVFVLLSKNYISVFCEKTVIKNIKKIRIIQNPSMLTARNTINLALKRKIILYVGRVKIIQKRIDRIMEIWEALSPSCPEWTLRIIGDGPDRPAMEEYSASRSMTSVEFAGVCDPSPSYLCASVLLLASDFEGFPLVLVEAMSYGVVPVVYNSFLALGDIVTDGVDGIIVEPKAGVFDLSEMARKTRDLLNDSTGLKMLAENAMTKSRLFSENEIYRKWEDLFYHFD